MASLPKEEWLSDAKRLAINSSKRVYHGAERRPNLVVRNLPDRWTCFCHSCHKGGVVMKEIVKIVNTPPEPKDKKARNDPGLLLPINLNIPNPNVPYADIALFLHSKDMALHYLQAVNPQWSGSDKRIVLHTPDQMVGRDLTGSSRSKWYSYTMQNSFNRARFEAFKDKIVVLTEDYFSALKGQWFAPEGFLCVSLMGTALQADLTVALCDARFVVLCLDNDKGGTDAAPVIRKTLSLMGIPHTEVWPELGADPKNMPPAWWQDMFLHSQLVYAQRTGG